MDAHVLADLGVDLSASDGANDVAALRDQLAARSVLGSSARVELMQAR